MKLMSTGKVLTACTMKMLACIILVATCAVACKPTKDAAGNKVAKAAKSKVLFAVYLKGLRVESFPKYDKAGEEWDAYAPFAAKPDIYTVVKWNETQIYKTETMQECEYGKPIVFSDGLPIELKPFDQSLLVEIFDEDGVSSNDNIGYFDLNLLQYKDWKTVVLSSQDKSLNVALELEWVYQ
ncbi:MAG: C2 domain-containing protein [Flavobacteriales bacterium]